MYIWEQDHWPDLTWESERFAALLGQVSREQGRLLGRMQDLGFELRREAQLSTLTEDVVRSSEIEGEKLDSDQVRSSIARRLGMEVGAVQDRPVEQVFEAGLKVANKVAGQQHFLGLPTGDVERRRQGVEDPLRDTGRV